MENNQNKFLIQIDKGLINKFNAQFPSLAKTLMLNAVGVYVGTVTDENDVLAVEEFINICANEKAVIKNTDDEFKAVQKDIDDLVAQRALLEKQIIDINTRIVQKKSALHRISGQARDLLKTVPGFTTDAMHLINKISSYAAQVQVAINNGTHHRIN